MKILCICKEGNVRSTAMAYVLKTMGHEALAAGWRTASLETFRMLSNWADFVFLAEDYMSDELPTVNKNKIINVGVGPDNWGFDMIKNLTIEVRPLVQEALSKINMVNKLIR